MPGNNILVAVDFSDVTDALLEEAVRFARVFDAHVYLVHVDVASVTPDFVGFDVGPVYVRSQVADQIRREHRDLEALEGNLKQQGIEATALLVSGEPSEKITDLAKRLPARFVLVGSHGHGWLYRLVAGSVVEGVLQRIHCPVVVVPGPEPVADEEQQDRTADAPAEA